MITDIKKTLQSSRKIPANMKTKIEKYLTSSSRYKNGVFYGLAKPSGLLKISSKASGVSYGGDKDGFFVYTHRARCKSHKDPMTITKKEIDFIESTG